MGDQLEVSASWIGGYECRVEARGHAITIDEPASAGGRDLGMMPTEAFCAALASCFCLSLAHVARRRRQELPGLRVSVRAHRPGRALRYGRLEVHACAEVPGEVVEALLEPARRVCWVSNTLAAGVELEYRYTSVDGRSPR
jgi:putative redox protein